MPHRPLICLVGLLLALTTGPALAQDKDAENLVLTTRSGVQIGLTYWQSKAGKESPVLVLLHDEGGNRKKWAPIASELNKAGYAVIAVDLRRHGESSGGTSSAQPGTTQGRVELKAADYVGMITDDLEAVKGFMLQKHQEGQFNIRKTGIVAIGSICAVALNFSGNDWLRKPYPDGATLASRTPRGQDVQTLVLISPESSVKGVKTGDAIRLLKSAGVSFLVIAGVKDSQKKASADKLFKLLQAGTTREKTKRMFYEQFPIKLNGEDLITRHGKDMLKLLLAFHDKQLKPIPQPWRDRRSKLDK